MQIVGLVLFAIGHFGTLASQSAMGASWRIGVDADERTELVAAGILRVARNPIFTAMAIASIGLALMEGNAAGLLAVVVLVLAVELQGCASAGGGRPWSTGSPRAYGPGDGSWTWEPGREHWPSRSLERDPTHR